MTTTTNRSKGHAPTSTVGRNRGYSENHVAIRKEDWTKDGIHLFNGDTLNYYAKWPAPTVIISDGGYGILGFEGDTSDHLSLPDWYKPHIAQWSQYATPSTALWFWNSEIGWAAVHPVLERYGWRYVNCNVWDKGISHIAGNVNTARIRRFPVVSELCVQYSFEARISDMTLRDWLRHEWKRTGLPWRKANEACGVKDAAVRKYLDAGHLWYFPPPEMFTRLVEYANEHGHPEGVPYFSRNGKNPMTANEWAEMRYKFHCPHGFTNVWNRPALHGKERLKAPNHDKNAAHLNQKPLDLMQMIIAASSDPNDIVWEPFGGLFSGCLAARNLNRRAYGCEKDPAYYSLAVERFRSTLL